MVSLTMKDEDKSKRQLIDELVSLRQQVAELKALESEHKQAEDALRESEAKWRSLVENAPASITTLDREGTILFTNRLIWLDRTAKQVIGTSIYNYLPPHEQEKTRQILETVFKSGGSVRYETTIIKDSDTRVSYENRVAPIMHDDQVVAALHIAIDITERKRIEQALAESERKLDNILSSFNDLIFVFDKEGRFTLYRSPTTEELYLPPEKFLGKRHSAVMPPHLNRPFARAFAENKEGKVAEYEYSLEIGGGTNWYSAKLSPVYSKGEFCGSVAVVRNITERKQAEESLRESEEKYRTLSANIPGMIYRGRADWSTEIISNSDMVCGYSVDQFNTQKINWLDLIHPDDKQRVFEEGSRLPEKPMSIVQEYRILAKDGSTRWVSDHKTSFFKEDGSFIGVDGIVYDVTERKQTDEELRQSAQQIEIAYRQAKIYAEELTEEIVEHKRAEEEIKKLNKALEQRVADRTRELSVLSG